ncbi:flagellar hook-length control protein FliK [Halomonas sp. 141]|uniref:flagellar hook-length control protein FliK n=2 Tax=Halomonas TaxID=2745 RepID=UPI0009BD5AEB|nr:MULTISPECIES: flagellar hook-length control protein FliK [unclassified Halomonas]PJX15086.1 flagellar hook-length control protein FliK [Halomonas sp. 141]
MSGITPLIDTLLHQVLGRQAEASSQRALNSPVQPVSPGEGPRALQGDASLDGRPLPPVLGDLRRLPGAVDGLRQPPAGEPTQNATPSSTQTHFSPAARTIADVLLRFPAPPAAIRPTAPLLSPQESPSTTLLASRLEGSIRDSGLFYESHLKRWFQGEMSLQQLLREPQMQPGPRPTALPLPGMAPLATQGTPLGVPSSQGRPLAILPEYPLVPLKGTAALLDRPLPLPVASSAMAVPSTPAVPTTQPDPLFVVERREATSAQPATVVTEQEMASRSVREVVHDSLQGVVRQQLEMLVTPTLRWEGDVWAGIFMALVVNLPGRDTHDEKQPADDAPSEWRSEIQLDVPELGVFSVALWLHKQVLSIDLTAGSLETYERLNSGLDRLEQRLKALDFAKVQVNARYIPPEEPSDVAR